MGASFLFTSADSGAPQLDISVRGSVVNVLKQCLVNGYGTKAPLGWTILYDDPAHYTTVFRNNPNVGSGCCLRVYDNAVNNITHLYGLRMYSSMDSADTGINKIPIENMSLNYSGFSLISPYIRRWYLLGDNRGFYFIVHALEYSYTASIHKHLAYTWYAGDIISLVPNYPKMFGLFANDSAVHYFGSSCGEKYTDTANVDSQYCMIDRNPITMKHGAVTARIVPLHPYVHSTLTSESAGIIGATAKLWNSVPLCADTCVAIPGPTIVGKMPGLVVPIYNYNDVSRESEVEPRYFSYGKNTFLRLVHTSQSAPNLITQATAAIFMFKIGDGFRV